MPAGHARYDGPSLPIGPSDSSLPRVEVRNGWHMVHLAHLPATRSLHRDGPEIYSVMVGSIFGKATKVAITTESFSPNLSNSSKLKENNKNFVSVFIFRDFSRFSEEWLGSAVVGFGSVTVSVCLSVCLSSVCRDFTSHVRRAGEGVSHLSLTFIFGTGPVHGSN